MPNEAIQPSKTQLSRLRDIGWKLWDPIGLLDQGVSWVGEPFADEYDKYLIHVASHLRRNATVDEMVDYLHRIEVDWMGLESGSTAADRLRKVVEAIQSEPDLWNWPTDQTY